MSTTSTRKQLGQRPIRTRTRGDGRRGSEALRAAIVEANYLNQISGRRSRTTLDVTEPIGGTSH